MFGKYFLSEMRKPDILERLALDMKPVFFQPGAIKDANDLAYKVYRNLEIISNIGRYDITIMPSQKIGEEFPKTFGHYHIGSYPELYEVLEGRAYFLLQRFENDPGEIREVYAVEAEAGEKIIMPPQYGHVSINVGKSNLVLANWIGFVEYDYETIKKYRGGCYYVLDRGDVIEFEKNTNYKSVPDLKKLRPRNVQEFGINQDKKSSIWELKNSPKKLEWLMHPEKYSNLLTIKKLYREI